jgi:NADH-quinone oxidoreductase subunit N
VTDQADMAAMVGDVLPEVVLVAGAVLVLLYAIFIPQRYQPGAALVALVVTLAALVVTVPMLGGPQALTFFDTYARDGAAVWAKLIVLPATAAVIGLSMPWFKRDPRHGEYYTLLLFSSLGSILLAGATDLQEFILAMLLSSATGFVLTGYHRRSSPAAEAAIKYYLIGALANSGLLIGVALLFGLSGSTKLAGLADGLPADGGWPCSSASRS